MNKDLKWFYIFFFITVFVIPFVSVFFSYDAEESTGFNDYARITDVDYKAVLVDEPLEGGKVVITEKLTYDIHAASINNLFWELWRDLPEDYVDGLKIDYKVNYVKQLKEDGTEVIYTQSPKLYWHDSDYTSSIYGPGKWYHSVGPYNEDARMYECVFFYVNGLYREEVTFEVQYEMHNAALRYSDVSELYLTMYSEETIKYLESFKGQILIPLKDMPRKGNYLAHTYGTNSHTFQYIESDALNPGYHTFSFNLDEEDLQFKNYNQYLEFSLLAFNNDKHIFTNYAPSNYYSNDVYLEEALREIDKYDQLPLEAEKNKMMVLAVAVIASVLILIFVIMRDKKIRKKYNLYKPSMTMLFFRDIPSDLDPYFAATLVFSKHKHKIDVGDSYSALMLSLVRKGYIELQRKNNTKDWVFNNILIKILYNPSLSEAINKNKPIQMVPYKNFYVSESKDLASNEIILETQTNNSLSSSSDQDQLKIPDQQPQVIERYNINGKKLEELSTNEEAYFNMIIRYARMDNISMRTFQEKVSCDYDNTDSFVTSVENSIGKIGIQQGYFQKLKYNSLKTSTNTLANKYIIFSIIIMTIGNIFISTTRLDLAYGALFILGLVMIISALYLKKIANNYLLFTHLGEDEYAKWRALYNFLNSETLMKERTVIELPLWEKYLVYATAFGISKKVVKALEIHCPDVANSPLLSNNYYRSNSFRSSSRSFRSAVRLASSISRTSRNSGGSYYGGGGRGGGGGGGGH